MEYFVDACAFGDDCVLPNDIFFDVEFVSLPMDAVFDAAVGFSDFEGSVVLRNAGRSVGVKFHNGRL